jgi:hypothetical protein
MMAAASMDYASAQLKPIYATIYFEYPVVAKVAKAAQRSSSLSPSASLFFVP